MTIKEFASLAGVSVSTVSKIMNGKDESISARTREHVLALAKEYNYVPYASAITPLTKTLTIGVIFRDSKRAGLMASSVLTAATAHGYSILLRESGGSPETELKNISAMAAAHVDGVLWDPAAKESTEYAQQLDRAGIPFVVMDADSELPRLDFQRMGYLATQALIRKHHTQIACIAGKSIPASCFYQGYRECLFENHLPFDEAFVFPDSASLPASSIANHTVSGVVIADYEEALKLFQIMDTLHYTVPYDLSIVTLRDDAAPVSGYPPLTALTIPYREYSTFLTESLIAKLEKRRIPEKPELPLCIDSSLSIDIPCSFRKKRVLSIGSINMDIYLNFEVLPRTGRTVTSSDSTSYPGGKCLNQAVGVAKLGHSVSVIGRVGNDEDSDMIYRTIKDLQIDSFGLKRSSDCRTGKAYIFVQRNGDSMISILSGANNMINAEDIKSCERLFTGASYCLIQTEIPMAAVMEAAAMAKKHGLTTVLKPSSCSVLPDSLLKNIDVIVPNTEELSVICPGDSSISEKASSLLSRGPQTVIVTLGADGCSIFQNDHSCHIPAADFLSVDNSGAADAFISALVSYLLYDYDIETAARIAVYAAGFSITRQGVSTALVDKSTLEAYLKMKEPHLLRE